MKKSKKCLECGQLFENQSKLSMHIRYTHKISSKDYYDKYLKVDGEEFCETCGKLVNFIGNGYRDFCSISCMRKSPRIQSKTRKTSIERHGGVGLASNTIKKKAQQTCVKKYGVKNPFLIEGVQQKSHSKEAREKQKQTMKDRYGVESLMQDADFMKRIKKATHTPEANKKRKQSQKKTCQERYGVDYTFQVDSVKQTIKQTMQERYGVDHISKAKSIKNKKAQTRLEEYTKFCEENNCTPNQEVLATYGTGWYQSGKFNDALIKYKSWYFVKNEYLTKIANYRPDNPEQSHFEKEVYDYIHKIYKGKIIQNDRTVISPYELDIYIPAKKVAIECNGMYWHSLEIVDKDYHLHKTELCEAKGIQLIHIFEDEWNEKKEICKSIISSALNKYKVQIDPKDCTIKKINNNNIVKDFLNHNHINGYTPSIIYNVGLFYKDELVQLLSIAVRYNQFEIIRFCNKLYTNIELNRLLDYQPYHNVIMYIDRDKYDFSEYNDLFQFIEYKTPNKFYWSYKTGRTKRVCKSVSSLCLYNSGKLKLQYFK